MPMDVKKIQRLVAQKLRDPQFVKGVNWNMYTSKDQLLVDEVIKFEDLESGLKGVLSDLDIDSTQVELPDLKANVRHLDPYEVLDAGLRDEIYSIFKEAFKTMGYVR
jgi:hypothetical protein